MLVAHSILQLVKPGHPPQLFPTVELPAEILVTYCA